MRSLEIVQEQTTHNHEPPKTKNWSREDYGLVVSDLNSDCFDLCGLVGLNREICVCGCAICLVDSVHILHMNPETVQHEWFSKSGLCWCAMVVYVTCLSINSVSKSCFSLFYSCMLHHCKSNVLNSHPCTAFRQTYPENLIGDLLRASRHRWNWWKRGAVSLGHTDLILFRLWQHDKPWFQKINVCYRRGTWLPSKNWYFPLHAMSIKLVSWICASLVWNFSTSNHWTCFRSLDL